MTTVGYIGFGSMGQWMAAHVLEYAQANRVDMVVYNRTKEKCNSLVSKGATLAPTLSTLASQCSIVFSCLSNDKAVTDVFDEILPALARRGGGVGTPQTIYVDSSTIAPDTARKIRDQAKAAGVVYVSSPVFGRPDAAKNKMLVSMPAGPQEAVEAVRPYLQSFSRAIVPFGEDQATALAMKLGGNFMIVSIIDLLGQAMTLTEKNGVSRDNFLEIIKLLFPSPIITGYATKLAADDLECPEGTGFASSLAIKDVGHMRALGQQVDCPLPFADIAMQHLLTLRGSGRGDLDWTAVGAVNREAAGLELMKKK